MMDGRYRENWLLKPFLKSWELQRGMLAEVCGDRTDAARYLLAAAHLGLVLADDYAQADQSDLALRSRLSAAPCFWRAGQSDQAHELFEAMIQDHPMQKQAIREVITALEQGYPQPSSSP
jgi:hypothetical protein